MKRRRIGPGVNRQCPRTTHDQQWWPPVAVAVAVWAAAASSTPSTYSNPRARGTHSSKANAAPAPPHPEGPAAAAARGPRGRNAAAAQTTTVRACTTATRPRASSARLPARGSGGARPRPRARSPRAGAWRRPPLQQEQRHTTDAPNHPPPPPRAPTPAQEPPRRGSGVGCAPRLWLCLGASSEVASNLDDVVFGAPLAPGPICGTGADTRPTDRSEASVRRQQLPLLKSCLRSGRQSPERQAKRGDADNTLDRWAGYGVSQSGGTPCSTKVDA